ncbi:MAG: lipopolysaccharide heptosyltransferase I [Limnohabitans sp.]
MVKLSSLGDVVHSLPAAIDMQIAIPGIHIDWVVEEGFAPLLRLCPAVNRVIPCRLRAWRQQWWSAQTRVEWRAFVQELQAHAYDAVIDLQGLTKSALIASLARMTDKGQRIAMANRTQGSAYEAPTRWVADQAIACAWRSHAVQRARHVCAQALGYAQSTQSRQTVFVAPDPHMVPRTVALIHGTSRIDKTWPLAHWIELGLQLNQLGFALAIPQSNDAEAKTATAIAAAVLRAEVWPRGDVLSLTRSLAACTGVIGVDSGPSHIAVALGLPHVQIYNFDTAWRTGPLDCAWQQSVFDTPCPTPEVVLHAWLNGLQAHVFATERHA